MCNTFRSRLAEWRDAESKASAAERSLTHLLFSRLDDPLPADGLVTEAKQLRELANEKLKAAIAALRVKR
ncbi:hypothetical protein [Ramlibacter sp.]|uniref:hypothetical protein n=1 Tax=Ramlibacter sp. TaxID=1917967 RepID=UPI002CA28AD3|nr:hypothetical protein [Ramlibacter sp.]HWI84649.1 hypothetical protein [Ramlibacter sp.]